MARSARSKRTKSHAKGFMGSVLVLAVLWVLGSNQNYLKATNVENKQSQDIGVEHTGAATLHWEAGIGAASAIVDVRQDGPQPMTLHLPQSWMLREVRGAAIADIQSAAVPAGYVEWMLSPRVTLSFTVPPPHEFVFHNAASTPLSVTYAIVDLATSERKDGVVLVMQRPTRLH